MRIEDLHETDDGQALNKVRVVRQTGAGWVDIATGGLVAVGEVVATIGEPPSES